MKRILLIAFLSLICFGCMKGTYTGSVKVSKVNGKVFNIQVTLPGGTQHTLRTREEATKFIDQMEGLMSDLKSARDQMPESAEK